MFVYDGGHIMREDIRHTAIRRNNMTGNRSPKNSRIRRIRQLRRRIWTASAIFCLAVVIGVLGCGFLSKAQSDDAVVEYKYFTSIRVEAGDTLYSVSLEYADEHYESVYDYMREICLTNHLLDEKINTGDYLVIPYYSSDFR